MKKILIIYASAGDGHKKAAEAIYKEFCEFSDGSFKAMPIDSLNYSTRFFKFSYKRIYIILIKYFPVVWGFFYHLLNNRFFCIIASPFRRLTNALNSKKLINFILNEKFDLVISTHFFATEVISHAKGKGIFSLPLINVVTDFKSHLYWIADDVDKYIVAADSVKEGFVNAGVDSKKIDVLGIPIRSQFMRLLSKEQARSKLDLSLSKFTVLVMGGGLGVGPIKDVVLGLQDLSQMCQIIVVCGHNKVLYKELNNLEPSFTKPTIVLGFSHNIDIVMAASDIMVSKVGGVSASESLSRGLPIICLKPIPGQEMGNAQFLFDNKIGFRAKEVSMINPIIEGFLHNKTKQVEISHKARLLSRSDSAINIVKLVMEYIE